MGLSDGNNVNDNERDVIIPWDGETTRAGEIPKVTDLAIVNVQRE